MNLPRKFCFFIAILIAAAATAQDQLLLEIKHYRFHSNAILNEHLFLYQHAAQIKTAKLPDDSISFYLENKGIRVKGKDQLAIIDALKYYRDSITTRDLLFDSTMRQLSTLLALNKPTNAAGWHLTALKHMKAMEAVYKKQIWPSIDSANKAWTQKVKADLLLHEDYIISRLQKIYGQDMPREKIRVDLGTYASWAGAYSYSEGTEHIIIGSFENANQGPLGVEIVFHEGSHFLIDKIYKQVADYSAAKKLNFNRGQTWHVILFYTTGQVVKAAYASKGSAFEPYYKYAKFEERIPPYKLTTTALALHWDPYMRGEGAQEEAITKVMDYILANLK